MMVLSNKRNIKFSLILFFLNHLFLIGQNSNEALKLLNSISAKVMSLDNLNFKFSYVLENSTEGIRQETSGEASLSKNLYRISFLGVVQIFDGSKIYTIIPENEEVNIEHPDDIESSNINVSNIFEFYKNGYDIQMDIRQKVNNELVQYIKLTPLGNISDLEYILIGLKTNKLEIYKIIEIGVEKTQTTLTITNQMENKQLPNNFFSFNSDEYSDYYINEN
tara:strand:- start:12 stop:674 length:663 start_codon:yes stop_codon:yes gene_type:complete